MAAFVDDAIWRWQGRKRCRLMADSEAELHGFAFRLGVHRLSFQGPPKTSALHYDITRLRRDGIVAIFRPVRAMKGEAGKAKELA